MHLFDLMSKEGWQALEEEIQARTGMCAGVFDTEGARVAGAETHVNPLCPVIKGNPQSRGAICALANQGIAAQARAARGAVVAECDAGICKIAVPIYMNGEFLGTVGGCGLVPEDGEVETFFVAKVTERFEDDVIRLADAMGRVSEADAEAHAAFIAGRVAALVAGGAR
ncbi:MAG: PocR ligand-binding domain-containing protein [Desulfovibrionaceae bacterium]